MTAQWLGPDGSSEDRFVVNEPVTSDGVADPRVTFSADGSATATWVQADIPAGTYSLVARRISAWGVVTPGTTVVHQDMSPPGLQHRVASGPNGVLTVAYSKLKLPAIPPFPHTYVVRRLAADGTLGPVVDLGVELDSLYDIHQFNLISLSDGNSIVGMAGIPSELGGPYPIAHFRVVNAQNHVGHPLTNVPGTFGVGVALAAGPGNTALAAWTNIETVFGDVDLQLRRWIPVIPPRPARLAVVGKPKVKPKRVRAGKAVCLTVKVRNTGGQPARNLKVCTKLNKKMRKSFGKRCTKVFAPLRPGATRTVKLKVKTKRKGVKPGKRYKLKLEVSARQTTSNAQFRRNTTARVRFR